MSDRDGHFMRRALRLARRGCGYVEPNPMVGAVVVRDNRIVGEGWHRRFGDAHAEVEALRAAGDAARNATLYVTLEPCCHHGKTGPCTKAVLEAGISRVVAAMVDPNPQVAGNGLRELERAGVEVRIGPLTHRAMELNEPFIKRQVTGLPFVISKWAATLDGAIATATGHSQWISSQRSRRLVHQLRARVDAIIVGVGTALADDPMLTARDVTVRRVARRVVIDPNLRLGQTAALVRTAREVPLTIATHAAAIEQHGDRARTLRHAGAELLALPLIEHDQHAADAAPADRRLDLAAALRHLAEEHAATNVLVEGGAGTHGAFFEQGLVDELWVFIAPKLLGDGRHLPPLSGLPIVKQIDDALPLELRRVRRLGQDVLLRYRAGASV